MVENNHNNEILDQAVEQVTLQAPKALKEVARTFAQVFYSRIAHEDLSENSIESLVETVIGFLDFSKKRNPGEIKIRIYVEKRIIKGYIIPSTIVEIVNDNMPFLVDSVIGAINSLGYSLHLSIHPVLQVVRDKDHILKKVFPRDKEEISGHYESYIHCEIRELLSPKKIKALENEISNSLNEVKASVEDWKKMKDRLESVIEGLKENPPSLPPNEFQESFAFLEWIKDDHFTFLGFCEYSFIPSKVSIKRQLVPQEGLGILRNSEKQEIMRLFEGADLSAANRRYILEPEPIILTKTTQVSLVHRRAPMDSISIKRFDSTGKVIGLYEFVGLFTSVAYRRSAQNIPLLRQKIHRIVIRSGFSEAWHDGKALLHILETFPRDELFQADEDWLFETAMAVLQLQNRQRLTLFIRSDKFERFVSCLVYIPRERYDSDLRHKIGSILEKRLNGTIQSWQTQLGELAFARVHYTIKFNKMGPQSYNEDDIEKELADAALTWRDHLQHMLIMAFGEEEGSRLYGHYGRGFSKGYQERFTPKEAAKDINEMEQVFAKDRLRANIMQKEGADNSRLKLKVYCIDKPVALSDILPVLENMNFRVLNEIPFIIRLSEYKKIWIHDFEMVTQEGDPIDIKHVEKNFIGGFTRIWRGEVENDGFNRLIIRANFTWSECQIFRAYSKYLRQLHVTYSQHYIESILAKYPHICHLFLQLFMVRFDPDCKDDREEAKEELLGRIKSFLVNVESLDEDRILNKFVNVICSTLRTNFFQESKGKRKPYLSFKINCESIDEMPLPRPKYEIYVYSNRVEGIHLRGGEVARGGIRWSDRREDFRTEILGLMKAQMVKNAVIIPVGSKGGFVIKTPPSRYDRKGLADEVVHCYDTLIRGMLDLTDNIQDNKVVSPPNVIRWDEDDTYLVVAADKGTATFSDYANAISNDYGFWLGDAFASGGSSGYDHKKMGITARGAWESVKRHFREMGIDASAQELSVVGIGDMSGDVFGNGMLYSKHLKLVAAFNHMHIFIDPHPRLKESYKERLRLFNAPGSSWADYNSKLISRGGGVFDRKAKSIKITREMKNLLGIQENSLMPSDLIRAILKAEVDLMWFGGIGTYIKSKYESNTEVEDRVNDALRINGNEVRAKVIAEGANLGITQLGRIEYAKNGGRLNTDAIDNSAGVDCSDHEVNLKILFGQALASKRLTLKKRNSLLEKMTEDVAQLVLKDNFWQNQAISLSTSQGLRLLDEQSRLMRDLEHNGLLDRTLEHLPDETEIARRLTERQGLTRPELSVLMAYSKISLNNEIIHSKLPDLLLLQPRLFSYFPEILHQKYAKDIKAHPLKREIVATLLTNSIVNRMGITFVNEMTRQTGVSGAEVVRSYVIVRDLLDLVSLWRNIESMETLPLTFQTELMLNIYENVKRATDWFLTYEKEHHEIDKTLDFFKPDFKILIKKVQTFFSPQQRKEYEEKCEEYEHLGLSRPLTGRLLTLEHLVPAPDMIMLCKETNVDIEVVAKIYFALGQRLNFERLRQLARDLSGESHWQQEASNALIEDLYVSQKLITKNILTSGKKIDQILKEDGTFRKDIIHFPAIEAALFELGHAPTIDFSMMMVVTQKLRTLTEGV